jgi:hypothetical protein
MFDGNPFNVRCGEAEAEVEGRCITRPSCDKNTQLEIDGRCVTPKAPTAFALNELNVNIFKPAVGVAVPVARPYMVAVSPADRFNLVWHPDDRLQATWLRISNVSEANRTEAGNVRYQVMIDPKGLTDSFHLNQTILFSSATATAPSNALATVNVEMTPLKIGSFVVAVPSLTKSRMQIDGLDFKTGSRVLVAEGLKVQLLIRAVDEDGLDVRRADRAFDFLLDKTGEEPRLVVANYLPAQSAYYAEVVLPQEDGEYQLRLHKVFGFDLLEPNGSAAATASLARTATLIVDSSKSRGDALKNTIIGSICGFLFALACFAMCRLVLRNRARAKELLLSFLRWEGIIVAEVCLELFDMTGALHNATDALPT